MSTKWKVGDAVINKYTGGRSVVDEYCQQECAEGAGWQLAEQAAMRDLLWGKCAVTVVIDEAASDDTAAFQAAINRAKPVSPPRCATCTHVHAGPCNGTSPNGHFSCPCGHPKVAAKVEMRETFPLTRGHRMDMHDAEGMDRERAGLGRAGRAMLLANLSREKPPGRRPIRTVARYEGNSDD